MRRLRYMPLIVCGFLLFSISPAAALSISLNLYSVDFGEMNMGVGEINTEIPPQGLDVECMTDAATPGWTLKIRNEYPFRHIFNPASVIPNTNFFWYSVGTTGNTAQLTYPVNRRIDFNLEETIYTGAAAENRTTVTLKFELSLPESLILQSGTYETRVVLTMTE